MFPQVHLGRVLPFVASHFWFWKGWTRGWHWAYRSHEEGTGIFRSNHCSVPSYLVFVENLHVMYTCPLYIRIYEQ